MEILRSRYFDVLPAKADVVDRLAQLGLGAVQDVRLFAFSSCTPAFCIDLEGQNAAPSRVVLRGEQQNDLSVTEAEERSMEKEIYTLKKIRNLGLNAPGVLFEGRTFAVPGYDPNGNPASKFRFFLMDYVEGIAIDRRIRECTVSERYKLFDKIAAIYARVHSVTGGKYGLIDGTGTVNNGCVELRRFLVSITEKKATLVSELVNSRLSDEILRFRDTVIPDLCDDIQQSDYRPQPRLVLYDASAGNMLIDGDRISLIDMDLAGYFEPVTEFCAFIFALKSLLVETGKQGRYWDCFLNSYVQHGGVLPPANLMVRLLHVMFVNILLHHMIYCKESRGPGKRGQVGQLVETISAMMSAAPKSIADIINLI